MLEKELVPTCHRFYHNRSDSGAGSFLKTIRSFWKAEFDAIEVTILEIVDATGKLQHSFFFEVFHYFEPKMDFV